MDHISLEQHMIDTIKEWQLKIGCQPGSMRLYYPKASLIGMLDIGADASEAELLKELSDFTADVRERLGNIRVSHTGERYCLEVPEKGCRYVKEQVPDPQFLKLLLDVLQDKGTDMERIRHLFLSYARENNGRCLEDGHGEEGLGRVFSFDRNDIDPYVYCVEQDDFGLTYHRFDRQDYEHLLDQN